MTENVNTQMCLEDKTEAPGDQSRPDLSSTKKKADAELATAGVSQVAALADVSEMSSQKQPAAPGGSERELGHTEVSQEGLEELQTQEQKLSARSGGKQSSKAAQEGLEELGAAWEPTQPRLCEAPEGLPQPDIESDDQRGRQQSPGMVEDQPPESCQGSTEQDLGRPCTLDSWGQPLGVDTPSEAGLPQVALPEPDPEAGEDNSQEALSPPRMVTTEKETASPSLPPMPGPQTPKGGNQAVEIQPTPRPPHPPERDIDKRKELDQTQKLQETMAASGVQSPRNTRPGFMKCLLEVEEQEQAVHRRAQKSRTLMAHRSPKTSVPTSGPVNSSALPQPTTSAPANIPVWIRPLVPGPSSVPVGTPAPVLPTHSQDPSWRCPELGSQASERSLNHAKSRQESEEHSLLKLRQSWEERSEEHLTPNQEEAFRSYFEIFNGPGEIDGPSLEHILHLIDFPLTPTQVEEALKSADVNGDGHVDFRDFLAVMTDNERFFCSVEQNVLMDMSPPNPHTLFFEILSLLVEMLAFPEAALEEITNYYQKKLKEGNSKAREMDPATGVPRSRKKLPHNPQQVDSLDVPERRVLRILSRLKQQNYAANLQSPYAQVPCIPLCPRLEKKLTRRKHGGRSTLDHCAPTGLSPDFHGLFQPGPQGTREPSSDSKKWLSSVPARTH